MLAPVPIAVFNRKLIDKKRHKVKMFSETSKEAMVLPAQCFNLAHPDAFGHVQHNVSLWLSLVVHTTSNDEYHCSGQWVKKIITFFKCFYLYKII